MTLVTFTDTSSLMKVPFHTEQIKLSKFLVLLSVLINQNLYSTNQKVHSHKESHKESKANISATFQAILGSIKTSIPSWMSSEDVNKSADNTRFVHIC